MDQTLLRIERRFPRGLSISREDLVLIGWLYLYEETRSSPGIPDSELRWIVEQWAAFMRLDAQTVQTAHVVQRLMRYNVLRLTITPNQVYRLTCLGQSLGRNLVHETDYDSEQLNVLLNCALADVRSVMEKGDEAFMQYLRHIFLGTIREKVEYKILAIEEDLDVRKKDVRRTYSGQNEDDFEVAIENIKYCRMALTELVDAVQESSACVGLEEHFHERLAWDPAPPLHDAIEQSLDFLYLLRSRIDAMLKDVVLFIHDCVAFRSLAFTVGSRERLRRIQERLLSYALENVVEMPVLKAPQMPRFDLNWSRQERERPVPIELDRLETLEDFHPLEPPAFDPEWKEPFLDLAKREWRKASRNGRVDLSAWVGDLMNKLPQIGENLPMAVWLLTQDWPGWNPAVAVEHRRGIWVPLGSSWLMEATRLIPLNRVIPKEGR